MLTYASGLLRIVLLAPSRRDHMDTEVGIWIIGALFVVILLLLAFIAGMRAALRDLSVER